MGRKVFISYKYADTQVLRLNNNPKTKVRDFVDIIQELIGVENVNKGEKDGEDLSDFKDSTIESLLRDRIYDSSVTLVVVSKGMKDLFAKESDQWIPWEISYSLKEHTRDDRISRTNAVLAVVLPDEFGNYNYCIKKYDCCPSYCTEYDMKFHFDIIRNNMFNRIKADTFKCGTSDIYTGYHSYIHCVTWLDFIRDVNGSIDTAVEINKQINDFELRKVIV